MALLPQGYRPVLFSITIGVLMDITELK